MNTRKWILATILLAILATALQLAGFVTPMWIWLDVGSFRVGVGLWYTTGCAFTGTCGGTDPVLAFGYSKDDTYSKSEFHAVQALQSLGLAAGVLLVMFLIVYRIGFGSWKEMEQLNIAAFVICILGWLCILTGLIVYCSFYWAVIGTSPLHSSDSFPWSFLMCFFAGLLYIIICVLIRIKCRDRDFLKHAIPTSGDSKMDLNPVTKHGIQNRYFTPLNYNEERRNHMGFGIIDESIHKRLLGLDEHTVTGIDNLALQGNTLENGISYRYLAAGLPNGDSVQDTETVIKRSISPTVVTYNDAHHNNLSASTRMDTVNQTAYTSNVFNTTHNHHRVSNSSNNAYNDNRPLLMRSTSTGSDGQAVRHRDSYYMSNAYNDNRRGGLVRSGSTGSLQGGAQRVYSGDYTTVIRRQDHTTNNAYQGYASENRGLVRSNSTGSLRQRQQQQRGGEGVGRYHDGQAMSARQTNVYHSAYTDNYGRVGVIRSGSMDSLVQDGRTQGQMPRNIRSTNDFNADFQSSNRRGLIRSASFGSQGFRQAGAGRYQQPYYRQSSADDAQYAGRANTGTYYQENRVTREAFGHGDRYQGGGEVIYTTVTRPVSYVSTRREVRQVGGMARKTMADADVHETPAAGDSKSVTQLTTHTRMGRTTLPTRFQFPVGSSVKLYDPTYIYRPYSEQIY